MFTQDTHPDTRIVLSTDQLLFMEPAIIIHPGMVHIIIQDPGHGDSTSHILHIMVGDSDGDIARAGLVWDLVMDMVMAPVIMVMDIGDVDGGAHLFIIPPVGVAGMVQQDLMVSTEIISTCIITSM